LETIRLVGHRWTAVDELISAALARWLTERGIVTAATTSSAVAPDPRPVLGADRRVLGARCTVCGYPVAEALARCPVCRGRCEPAAFGPLGTVFAATVLRVPVPDRPPPNALAYVDLDDGPRILAHVARTDLALAPSTRVRLVGTTEAGDPLVSDDLRDEHEP
jgi:hypothetical protein